MNIYLPDYKENSILSLMQNISDFIDCRVENSAYQKIPELENINLKKYHNIIMIIIDGLGYNILRKLSNESDILYENCLKVIDSVLPSTTISAVTSFSTGISPAEHGALGWNMKIKGKDKELVAQLLSYREKGSGKLLFDYELDLRKLLNLPKNLVSCSSTYKILPEDIRFSPYFNELLDLEQNNKTIRLYRHPVQCLNYITQIIDQKKKNKQFIYSYFPHLDKFAHIYGCESGFVKEFYKVFMKALSSFLKRIDRKNNLVLITADHGLLDSSAKECVRINDFTGLKEALDFPVCGESRFSYFYVKSKYKSTFLADFKAKLSPYGYLLSTEEMIDLGVFGPKEINNNKFLRTRIGDFGYLMKENFLFKDENSTKGNNYIGNHGSNSIDELKIPIIVFN